MRVPGFEWLLGLACWQRILGVSFIIASITFLLMSFCATEAESQTLDSVRVDTTGWVIVGVQSNGSIRLDSTPITNTNYWHTDDDGGPIDPGPIDTLPTGPTPPLPPIVDSSIVVQEGTAATLRVYLTAPDQQLASMDWALNISGSASAVDFFADSLGRIGSVIYEWSIGCDQLNGTDIPSGGRTYTASSRSNPKTNVATPFACDTGTPPPIIPPPVDTTPPPPGAVSWNFNDPNDLGLQKSLPNMNKQFWDATGGTGGDGAIRVEYWTGMPIGWTQLNLDEQPPSHHWTLTMWAKIVSDDGTNTMQHEGSSIKLVRTCNAPSCPGTSSNPPGRIGTWEYHLRQNPAPVCRFIPDHWSPSGTQSKNCQGQMPTDGLWHEWEIEFDARDLQAIKQIFRVDGVELGRMQYRNQDPQGRDLTGPLNISPFVDMYSCGQPGCDASVNVGRVYFDDVTFLSLAP